MDIFSVFTLCGGLAFFLYGMTVMSKSLEKMAGGKLERMLKRMTSSPFKSLLLGAGITIAIQSSSAMTVMLVGLVNSGVMELRQTIGIIMGSNIGTTLTAWILSLTGIESENVFVNLLKPENFSPLIALAGILLIMGSKRQRRRDVGRIMMGFAILMYGMELMMAILEIIQGVVSTIMNSAGFGSPQATVLPQEIITAVEDCGFFESIPLWAVTLIGGLFIWVLSFVMILSVYGRFFKMYMYTALAPVPLSAFAGEPTQNIGKSFMKSYASVCLEGAIIVLACIIFSVFASSPPVVDPNAAPASMVWSYIGELIFNMLILVGAVKMADRLVKEMMGI